MVVFRQARERCKDDLSGRGAALRGGRWNLIGTEIIYTSESHSLAMAEILVHHKLDSLKPDYFMLTMHIPDRIEITQVLSSKLPNNNWNNFPHLPATQKLGDQFIEENKYAVMKVPSAVTKGDHNSLVNPYHKDFDQIEILDAEEFLFDQRLFE